MIRYISPLIHRIKVYLIINYFCHYEKDTLYKTSNYFYPSGTGEGALKAGATKEEILETICLAIVMGGGLSIVYGDKAYKAMNEMM